MKEREIMRICFFGSIAGIVFIYIVVLNMATPGTDIGKITGSFIGQEVNVTGTVSDVYRHTEGHFFFTLDDGSGSIRVVLWDDIIKEMDRRGMEPSGIRDGTMVNVIGEVSVYRGELEVIPKSPTVKFL